MLAPDSHLLGILGVCAVGQILGAFLYQVAFGTRGVQPIACGVVAVDYGERFVELPVVAARRKQRGGAFRRLRLPSSLKSVHRPPCVRGQPVAGLRAARGRRRFVRGAREEERKPGRARVFGHGA